MPSYQQVIVIGHLGQDPEVKFMPSGKAVCNISVATSEKWKDKESGQDKQKTEWHRVCLFGRLAEVCGEYLKKGSAAMFIGKLQTRKWKDNNNIDRYTTEIIAREMKMLGGGRSESNTAQSNRAESSPSSNASPDDFDDDIPF